MAAVTEVCIGSINYNNNIFSQYPARGVAQHNRLIGYFFFPQTARQAIVEAACTPLVT